MANHVLKRTRHSLGIIVLTLIALGGCSQVPVQTYPPIRIPAPDAPIPDASDVVPPTVVEDTVVEEQFIPGDYVRLEELTRDGRPAAVHQLISSGRVAWQEGDTNEALQKFNRAMRISPNDGLIYFYLASISLEELDTQQAVSLARRGLSLSRNPVLRQQLEHLLSAALEQQSISR